MKLIKLVFIFFYIFFSFSLYSQDNIPKLFQLKWGLSFDEVQTKILKNNIGPGKLTYYAIFEGKDEASDLKSSSAIKYSTKGSPFFNIPAEIIFTFYNSSNNKNKLELSKIEVYLKRKDNDGIWVDVKRIFKSVIRMFFDNYNINLRYSQERQVFRDYDYQVTVNGVYVNVIANTSNNILDKSTSVFISYESNKYQSMIMKEERELIEGFYAPKTDEEKMMRKTKDNL